MKKENRIKKNEEIASIVNKRQRVFTTNYTIYYQPPATVHFRVAISVSKKNGNAVKRNHAKRVVREIIRPIFSNYEKMDIVVVVKKSFEEATFEQLQKDFAKSLSIISKRIKKD